MDLRMLFDMQRKLDEKILKEHNLHKEKLLAEKLLALRVEVGELANETRCFKYWSKKNSSPKHVVIEEYVDGLHFILSIGLDFSLETIEIIDDIPCGENLVDIFHKVYDSIGYFRNKMTKEEYDKLINNYFELGFTLGFSKNEIYNAYMGKNEINHERQNQGY